MTTTILNLDGSPVRNFDNPDRKVMWSKRDIWGDRVYGSLRTIAHLDQTSKRAVRRWGHEIEVIQGAYNDDIEQSAGTHDYDAVLDVFIPNIAWWTQQRWLRYQGWAAWYRYPPTFGYHIHMISLGYSTRVGIYVPGQVDDYYAHRDGLATHYYDGSDHPDNIASTIFHFAEWEREMRENMPLDADDMTKVREAMTNIVQRELSEAIADIARAVATEMLGRLVDTADETTVRAALRRAENSPDLIRALAKAQGIDLGTVE